MATRLYVGRLPYDCRTRDLERLFDEFGDIRDIDIHNGYAFVEYYSTRAAEDAVCVMFNCAHFYAVLWTRLVSEARERAS